MPPINVHLDRWLLCSEAVEQAIRGPWSRDVARNSLAGLRIAQPLVEVVAPQALGERVRQLVAQGCGTLRVVVERYDAIERAAVAALNDVDGDLRLHIWRDSPLDVMATLAAPEACVIAAWKALRRRPDELVFEGPLHGNDGWSLAYGDALKLWEREARAELGAEFDEEFGVAADAGRLWSTDGRRGWKLIERLGLGVRGDRAWITAVPQALGLAPQSMAIESKRGKKSPIQPVPAYGQSVTLPMRSGAQAAKIDVRRSDKALSLACSLVRPEQARFGIKLFRRQEGGTHLLESHAGVTSATFENVEVRPGSSYAIRIVEPDGTEHDIPVEIEELR